VFAGKGQNDQGLQPFAVADFAAVKRVKGSLLCGNILHKLSFAKKDGTEISKVEFFNDKPYGPDF
jgi:hypothetical protein